MREDRVPFDLAGYQERVRSGACFICDLVAGAPGSEHEIVFDDGAHIAVQPLTPRTPYEQQQFHALMAENGVIPWSDAEAAELGGRLRAELGSGR